MSMRRLKVVAVVRRDWRVEGVVVLCAGIGREGWAPCGPEADGAAACGLGGPLTACAAAFIAECFGGGGGCVGRNAAGGLVVAWAAADEAGGKRCAGGGGSAELAACAVGLLTL